MDRLDFLAGAAALWLAPGAFARRLGGNPVALVTADTQAHVAVVELSSGRVLARIRTIAQPRSVETVYGTVVLVAHSEQAAVSLVDGKTRHVVTELLEFDEPRYTAAQPAWGVAFVTDSGSGELVAVDVRRGRVVGRIRVGGPARHLSLSPAGSVAWVSLGSTAEQVAVIDVADPRRPRLLRRVRPPFPAHDVGFEPAGRRVWVTSGDRRSLAVHEARSGHVLGRLRGDAPPQHVAFSRGLAYVTSGDSGTLRVHDVRSGRSRRTTGVPYGSYNVDRAGDLVVTPSLARGTLCVLHRDGRLLRRIAVASSSHDAAVVVL